MHEILTTEEMAEADRRAVALGVTSLTLMENAGRAVADEAQKMVAPGSKISVLCGPGNNGGDGFVAARHLKERGHDVRVACLVPIDQLKGDASEMVKRYGSSVPSLSHELLRDADLVIDALFGAGLTRPVSGVAADLIQSLNEGDPPTLAIDVPSGLNGTTGQSLGCVVRAKRTVTFFRKKPGHLLIPGRECCGDVVVADIGLPQKVLENRPVTTFENHPDRWLPQFPWPRLDGHKYTRGHAVVVSGPAHQTGAARLAARGALRIGSGLVTIASPHTALAENAGHLTAIMLKPFSYPFELGDILDDKRKNVVLIGPGSGVGDRTRDLVKTVLRAGAKTVLDADALTSFEDRNAELISEIHASPNRAVVMTPHEGEFGRLFPELKNRSSKLDRAREAALLSGAIVVLKGPDTVIAAPDGRAAINTNAPQTLATAGSGDVLAGFITGLLAQGMPAFEASCAAVWLHGECANKFGVGLIAEDLPEILPKVLAALLKSVET